MKKLFTFAYYLLIGILVVVGATLLISLFPVSGNIQIKIVLSGSMEPAIKTGSVVIIKPADSYTVGDIVTFGKDTKEDVPTTHRITSERALAGEKIFETKGDANEDEDPRDVRESEVIGKVLFSVPYMGYVLDFARKPFGFALIIGVPAAVVAIDEGAKIWAEVRKPKKKEDETT